MGLRDALATLWPPTRADRGEVERATLPLSFADFLEYFRYAGSVYPVFPTGTLGGTTEEVAQGFEGFVTSAYKTDGVVFACMLARLSVFSDVRFVFREIRNGTPGDLIGNPDGRNPASQSLAVLQNPWPGATTGDLLARIIQDADLAGNSFTARVAPDRLVRLRPDWVNIVARTPSPDASLWDPRSEVAGYIYTPGGPGTDDPPVTFAADQVAHFAPNPDPVSRFRGMSWMETVIPEILADRAATNHKLQFFQNGATVNFVMEYPPGTTKELFDLAVKTFKAEHEGVQNAYKTLHVLSATAKPVGATMEQADFKRVQGAGETRIAAAAGVPPIIVGLSEGLDAATYSNYGQARRAFADRTIRPLWRNVCGSLSTIVTTPPRAELWYDDSDVAFIREDQKDAAEIRQIDAATIKSLVDGGFTPASAADAVTSGDLKRLVHTGFVSVQLQPLGSKPPMMTAPQTPPGANGNQPEPQPAS